ncbi:MAG: nitroreductase family protein [Longimicrobiales bacterium]|nr:nitroreductase family protein [Longimicrobiales bacterium]
MSESIKVAPTEEPLDEGIRKRWSPRAFSDREVGEEELRILVEAARWAPSSYNEQPWRFIVARRSDADEFRRMLGCLKEQNREWASGAPVLMLTVAKEVFERNGKENRHAFHDVGLAMGNLLNQATEMEIYVHQMAGIHPDRAREEYDIPDGYAVVAGVALGYLGDPEQLDDEDRREAETSPRSRKPLEDLVYEGSWAEPAEWATEQHRLAHAAATP